MHGKSDGKSRLGRFAGAFAPREIVHECIELIRIHAEKKAYSVYPTPRDFLQRNSKPLESRPANTENGRTGRGDPEREQEGFTVDSNFKPSTFIPQSGNGTSIHGNGRSAPVERFATGSAGLDDIPGGGLARNYLYLVEGDPGTGKTTIAMQFLMEGVRRGRTSRRPALSVIKKRSGEHERTIRELVMRNGVITVGEVLTEFDSVLTGSPTFRGRMDSLQRLGSSADHATAP
jgi:hypothetical protein